MRKEMRCLWFLFLALGVALDASSMDHGFILSPDQAELVLKQCSRPTPRNVDGAWAVPPAVVTQLERDLGKLSELKSHQCCISEESVQNPDSYLRQYVGVTIQGRKYVYINAFREPAAHWRNENVDAMMHKPITMCDGGDSFWGALYDPETRQFSEVAFNGAI
jgi:hypothetical protein